jgi:hypothetical protein
MIYTIDKGDYMNWLALIMAFQIGTADNSFSIDGQNYYVKCDIPENSFYVQAEFGARIFEHIKIINSIKSYQFSCEKPFFSPYRMEYDFSAQFDYKGFNIGFRHKCIHPVLSSALIENDLYAGNTELYFGYKAEIPIF